MSRTARPFLLILAFSCLPILSGSGSSAGTAELSGIADDLDIIPAKLEKKTLTVRPRLDYSARDRRVQSSVLAEMGSARIRARTVYNAVTEELGYQLWYGYGTRPFSFGFSLSDRVEFKKEVGNVRFIGRERVGGLEIQAPLKGRAACRLALSGGEYTTVLSAASKIVIRQQTVSQEWTLGIFPVDRGARISLKQASRVFQGDFQYQAVEIEAGWRVPDSAHRWIVSAGGMAGTPVRCRGDVPLYERYYLGGYETLPGWRLYEWSGESAAFGRAGLRIPVREDLVPRGRKVWFSELSWITHFHAAAAGERSLFRDGDAFRFSLTSGLRLGFNILGETRVHLQAEWSHAIHDARPDVFYVSLGIS